MQGKGSQKVVRWLAWGLCVGGLVGDGPPVLCVVFLQAWFPKGRSNRGGPVGVVEGCMGCFARGRIPALGGKLVVVGERRVEL